MLKNKYFLSLLGAIFLMASFVLINQVAAQDWQDPEFLPGQGPIERPLTNPMKVDLNFQDSEGTKHNILNAEDVRGNRLCIGVDCRNAWPTGGVTNPMSTDLDGGTHKIYNLQSCQPKAGETCYGLQSTPGRSANLNAIAIGYYSATDAGSGGNPNYAVYGASQNSGGVGIYGSASAGYAGYFNGTFGVLGNSTFTGNVTVTTKVTSPQYCIGLSCIVAWPGAGYWTATGNDIYNNNGSNVGNVGIGTAGAPGAKLEIKGSANATQLMVKAFSGQTVANPLIKLVSSTGTLLSSYHSNRLENNFLGANTGRVNTGVGVTLIGGNAGYSNTSGYDNTAVGYQASYSTTDGDDNVAVGWSANQYNVTGSYNTILGAWSGLGTPSNSFNEAAIVGYKAGYQLANGANGNVLFGYQAGYNITSGARNIVIGHNINAISATGSNQMTIGNLLFGTGLDGVGSNISTGKIGIGVNNPATRLEVSDATSTTAQLRITDDIQNPELQFQYGTGADDHWGIYASNPNNSPAGDGNLIFWANGDNRLVMTQAGEIYAYSFYYSSDQSLKYNINTIYQPLEKIKQLRGVTFNWKETNEPSMGFVAQEVEKVLPDLVKTNSQGLKSVEYGNLTAILVEAIKAQQQQIEQLQTQVSELQAK